MFYCVENFNQPLNDWNVQRIDYMNIDCVMFKGTPITKFPDS